MSTPTTDFFDRLQSQPQPLLSQITGSIRFDLDDGHETRHWFVELDKGKVAVSHRNTKADAVVRVHRALFDRLVTGEANTLAAALRGLVVMEGNPQLLVQFQRVLPGPPAEATVGAMK